MSKRDEITRALMQPANAVALTAPRPTGPMSFVARAGQQAAAGLAAEIERLKAERSAGMVLLRLDPKTIRPTEFANRHALSLKAEDAKFKGLKASIAAHGQDVPVRVRPAPPGKSYAYELIDGHRRLAACLALDAERDGGFQILARLDGNASAPKELVLTMYRENAEREDLSPYEHGRMFQSWLDAKVFAKQGELAEAIGASAASVSQYLAVAGLPEEVILAFGDPRTISLRWMQGLSRALKADRPTVIAAATQLASSESRSSPDQILRALIEGEKRPSPSREEAIKIAGKVAFRIARRDGRLSLKFGKQVDRAAQRELTEEIKELVEKRLNQRLKGKT